MVSKHQQTWSNECIYNMYVYQQNPKNEYVDVDYNGPKCVYKNESYSDGLERKKKRTFGGRIVSFIIPFALIVACFYAYMITSKLDDSLSQLLNLQEKCRSLDFKVSTKQKELAQAGKDFTELTEKISWITHLTNTHLRKNDLGKVNIYESLEYIMQRHDIQADKLDALQQSIQQFYRLELEER